MDILALSTLRAPPHREGTYTDSTKPRPWCRGMLHGLETVALCIAIAAFWSHSRLVALGLLGKLCNIGASAFFHLYPFRTTQGETLAYAIDMAAVPFSAVASVIPFIDQTAAGMFHELALAATVLVGNAVAVAWQTRGQVGLKPLPGSNDTPRSILVTAYSLYVVIVRIGVASAFSALWASFLFMALLMGLLTNPINAEHEKEPTAPWARWHVRGVYSFHEDFHLVLLVTDLLWLSLALRQQGLTY